MRLQGLHMQSLGKGEDHTWGQVHPNIAPSILNLDPKVTGNRISMRILFILG